MGDNILRTKRSRSVHTGPMFTKKIHCPLLKDCFRSAEIF